MIDVGIILSGIGVLGVLGVPGALINTSNLWRNLKYRKRVKLIILNKTEIHIDVYDFNELEFEAWTKRELGWNWVYDPDCKEHGRCHKLVGW